MRGYAILVCTALVLGAASVRADVTTDPAMMANAIRDAGSECDEVKSMKQDPNEARVYHVVCDEGVKYKVLWQDDDTVLVYNE
jgi:hypothetical protein